MDFSLPEENYIVNLADLFLLILNLSLKKFNFSLIPLFEVKEKLLFDGDKLACDI